MIMHILAGGSGGGRVPIHRVVVVERVMLMMVMLMVEDGHVWRGHVKVV